MLKGVEKKSLQTLLPRRWKLIRLELNLKLKLRSVFFLLLLQ